MLLKAYTNVLNLIFAVSALINDIYLQCNAENKTFQ